MTKSVRGNAEILWRIGEAKIAGKISDADSPFVWASCLELIEETHDLLDDAQSQNNLAGAGNASYYQEKLGSLRSYLSALFDAYDYEDHEAVKNGAPKHLYHFAYLVAGALKSEN